MRQEKKITLEMLNIQIECWIKQIQLLLVDEKQANYNVDNPKYDKPSVSTPNAEKVRDNVKKLEKIITDFESIKESTTSIIA